MIGFHTGPSGNPTGIGDYVRKMDENSLPAVIVAADTTTGLSDIVNMWENGSTVQHVGVYRVVLGGDEAYAVPRLNGQDYGGDPITAARSYWEMIRAKFPPELIKWKSKLWFAWGNELSKDAHPELNRTAAENVSWIASFCSEGARLANLYGFRIVAMNWSAGTPEPSHFELPEMLNFLRLCSDGRAALGLHEYSYTLNTLNNPLIGRYQLVNDICRANNIKQPHIIITEFGWTYNKVPSPQTAINHLKEVNYKPNVLGAAIWYLGGGDIANLTQKLIAPVTEFNLSRPKIAFLNTGFSEYIDQPLNREPKHWTVSAFDNGETITSPKTVKLTAKGYSTVRLFTELPVALQSIDKAGDGVLYLESNGITCFEVKQDGTRNVPSVVKVRLYSTVKTATVQINYGTTKETFSFAPTNGWKVIEIKTQATGLIGLWFRILLEGEGVFMIDEVVINELMTETGGVSFGLPREQYKRVVHVPYGNYTDAQLKQVYDIALTSKQTASVSLDDAGIGNLENKTAIIYLVDSSDKAVLETWFEQHYPGTKRSYVYFNEPLPEEPTDTDFKLTHWPTKFRYITQKFGVNFSVYSQFGLPGHNGVDIKAPMDSPIYCAADGTVERVDRYDSNGKEGGYGTHVRVKHANGYLSLYAHLRPDVQVTVGQLVKGGQLLGYSGNTGFSTGPHLHFEMRHPDGLAGWPWGVIDCTPFVDTIPLYLSENGNNLGWVWGQNTVHQGNLFYGTTNLNIRSIPSVSGTKLGTLEAGIVVKGTGKSENGYVQIYFVGQDQQPVPSIVDTKLGVHLSADSHNLADDMNLLSIIKPKAIKALSSHKPEDLRLIYQLFPNALYVVRAFLSFGGRHITPQQFYNDTVSDLKRTLAILPNAVVEVHNEPNLFSEGLGSSWGNGAEFNTWLADVVKLYRQSGITNKMIYPGLSPGPSSSLRLAHYDFINDESLNHVDGLGVHVYWSNPSYQINTHEYSGFKLYQWYRNRFPAAKIYVTEMSNNTGMTSPIEKAKEYKFFTRTVDAEATFIFVLSASNNDWVISGEVINSSMAQELGKA